MPTSTTRSVRSSSQSISSSAKGPRLGVLPVGANRVDAIDVADAPPLDRGGQVYGNARLVLRLRNAIIHFRPEDRSAEDELDKLQKGLRERGFADNALMEGSGNPWWPDKALGYGAAEWAHLSVQALSDHVSDAIGIVPIYRKVEAGGWFGQAPGEGEPV